MSVTAFATELNVGNQTEQSTLSFTEPSTYTVIITDTIYVSPETSLEFETTFLNIQDTEQLVIRLNNLDENNRLLLSNESGASLHACFEVANDTDICYLVNPDCTVVYAARMGLHYETPIIPAGEYTGIAEFTVSVEPKVM